MTKRTEERASLILGHPDHRPAAVPVSHLLRDHDENELQAMADVLPLAKEEPEVAFCPLYDRVLVVPDDVPEEATPGGVIITPDTAREEAQTGILVDAGLQARDIMKSHGIRLGDRVMWARYAGINGPNSGRLHPRLSWKKKKVHILKVQDLLGNFTAPDRFESGEAEIKVGPDGLHYIEEKDVKNGNS